LSKSTTHITLAEQELTEKHEITKKNQLNSVLLHKLLREIRDMIYEYAVGNRVLLQRLATNRDSAYYNHKSYDHTLLNLSLSCRQLHAEAMPIIYKTSILCFELPHHINNPTNFTNLFVPSNIGLDVKGQVVGIRIYLRSYVTEPVTGSRHRSLIRLSRIIPGRRIPGVGAEGLEVKLFCVKDAKEKVAMRDARAKQKLGKELFEKVKPLLVRRARYHRLFFGGHDMEVMFADLCDQMFERWAQG
jgi:hypothetical protein